MVSGSCKCEYLRMYLPFSMYTICVLFVLCPSVFCHNPSLESKYTIIDNISLSYDSVEYCLPILQEKKIVIKGFNMLKMQSLEQKKTPYIHCQIFINYFLTIKVDFKI